MSDLRFRARTPAILVALALVGRPSFAAERGRWTVQRSPDADTCPDADTFVRKVAEAASRDPREVTSQGKALDLDVEFTKAESAYRATVRSQGARNGMRTLSAAGDDCGPLTDAVVVATTILVDEIQREGPAEPAPTAIAQTPSRAELPPAAPPPKEGAPFRLGLAIDGGYAYFHRTESSPRTQGGVGLGAQVRIHPYSRHGFVGGVFRGAGIFGPGVTVIDAGYSLALFEPEPLDRGSLALFVELGPSFGIVEKATPSSDHTVLGLRGAVSAEVQISNFLVGASIGYRGGVPLTPGVVDGWEGALTGVLRLGASFDLGHENPSKK